MHDGTAMKRIHISVGKQVFGASVAAGLVGLSAAGVVGLTGAGPALAGAFDQTARMARMQAQVAAMRSDVAQLKIQATAHAAALDAKQALLAAVITGKGDTNAVLPASVKLSSTAADVVSPLNGVASKQNALAGQALALVQARYKATAATLARVGVSADRLGTMPAMGGPYEPVDASAARSQPDPTFRALFQSWKQLDALQHSAVSVPSSKPVDAVTFTSNFGVRSDPFRGTWARHDGVDIPGPVGTPIYATADGTVGRAQWAGGYGNLVELEHGHGLQTRYGHLSAILVTPGQHVSRGQQIARMGSTGRSTGPHLHYEVRMDGSAMNPMPFLQMAGFSASNGSAPAFDTSGAVGGPAIPARR